MNNSDFLSEAVALDLGKSGVKVAETLEIQAGEQWWRLINAATVTEGEFYRERRLSDPVIVGDTIYTESLRQEAGGVIPQISIDPILFTAGNGDMISIWYCADVLCQIQGVNHTSGSQWKYTRTGVNGASTLGLCYWDAPNERIVYTQRDSSASFFGSLNVSGTVLSDPSYATSKFPTDFYKVIQFPEIPNDVYSLWWVNGASPRIKKTTCTTGANIVTQTNTIVQSSGATLLSAITGVPLANGVFPFYLRTYSSVGVAWLDPITGIVKYVLEKDSWGTVYSLPNIAPGETAMTGFGNFVLHGDTEMVVAQFDRVVEGTMELDTGYSFPANFILLGATRVSNGVSRIWGAVGTTLYCYTLNHATMHLSYEGVVSTAWTGFDYPLSRTPICVAKQGDLELILFQYKYIGKVTGLLDYEINWSDDNQGPAPIVCLYRVSTNSFIAIWDGWQSSTTFPTTYNKSKVTNNIWKCGNYLIFCKISSNRTTYIEIRRVAIASIFSSTNTEELNSLVSNSPRKMVSGPSSDFFVNTAPTKAGQDPRSTLFELKNDAGYVFPLTQAGWRYELEGMCIIFDPVSMSIVTNKGSYLEHPQYAHYSSFGVQGLLPNDEFSYYGDISGADPNYDTYYRLRGSLQSYFVMNATWSRYAAAKYTAHFSVSHGGGWHAVFSMTGKKNESLCYNWKRENPDIAILGGSIYGNNTGGHVKTHTLQFDSDFAFMDERSNLFLVFGTPSGSTFPYGKITGVDGMQSAVRAVRLEDNAVYNVDMDVSRQGGLATTLFLGSWILAKTVTGKSSLYSTNAKIDEGIGGSGVEDSVSVIYFYDTKSFIPYPFAREGIRAELSNISKTTKITLPETQDNLIRGMLAAGTDFRGSRCILRRVFPDHLDEAGSDIVLLDGYIQDWSYVPGKKGIAFSVSKTLIDVGAQFPKRLMNMGCSHVFKGERCKYLGETGRCLKTKAFCQFLNNQNQFGGFPWVAARQRRVMWR